MPEWYGKKVYIKDESFDPIYTSINKRFLFKSKIMSGGLMALGFLILGTQVVLPLVSFKTQDEISKPMQSSVLGVATGFTDFEFKELQPNSIKPKDPEHKIPDYFSLSIPKLGIEDALIETNSNNLSPDESLAHYNGSSLPGEIGDTFIHGHSVLPWFFNPKNYKTIFSTLGDLEAGDTFTVKYNDKTLTYKVESQEVKYPDDINPLAEWKPEYLNESTATLMTCWPAGTKTKRLMIRAVLID